MMDLPATAVNRRIEVLPASRFRSLVRKSISAHAIFGLIVAGYFAGFLVLLRLRPDMATLDFSVIIAGFLLVSIPIMLVSVFIMRFYHVARHVKPERPIPALLKDLWQYLSSGARMANGIPMVILMIVFMYVFVGVKASIPNLNPYSWDHYFSELDRTLHFGVLPWEWLQPLLGHPVITFVININYNCWFLVMWMTWVYFAFADRPSLLRTRFFLSFFLMWILIGGILAIVFSSAGPCYYGRLGLSPDPYAGLMAYLRGVNEVLPVWAIPVQDVLWQGHIGKSAIDGISAMPSMHNGSALLFALAGYQVSRFAGHLLTAHAILIFIGSVHLGWHYAVDSYLAWALTLVIWFAVWPIAHWWHSTAVQGDFDRAFARAGA
ncbi:MAG: phosphatase PAP2 family protein [Aestuariivirga sp.]